GSFWGDSTFGSMARSEMSRTLNSGPKLDLTPTILAISAFEEAPPDEQPASKHTEATANITFNIGLNLPNSTRSTAQRGHRFDQQICGELRRQRGERRAGVGGHRGECVAAAQVCDECVCPRIDFGAGLDGCPDVGHHPDGFGAVDVRR